MWNLILIYFQLTVHAKFFFKNWKFIWNSKFINFKFKNYFNFEFDLNFECILKFKFDLFLILFWILKWFVSMFVPIWWSSVSVDQDACSSDPCGQNGHCINLLTGYLCQCRSGYEGRNCETGEEYLFRCERVYTLYTNTMYREGARNNC